MGEDNSGEIVIHTGDPESLKEEIDHRFFIDINNPNVRIKSKGESIEIFPNWGKMLLFHIGHLCPEDEYILAGYYNVEEKKIWELAFLVPSKLMRSEKRNEVTNIIDPKNRRVVFPFEIKGPDMYKRLFELEKTFNVYEE